MKPSPKAIRRVVASWEAPVEWPTDDWRKLSRLLVAIGLANGGRVSEDVPLSQRTFDWFFFDAIDSALSRAMRLRAEQLRRPAEVPYRMVPCEEPRAALAMVAPRRPAHRIDLNRARVGTLARLEGMDEEKARLVVAYRKEQGPFEDLEPLVDLVGKQAARRLGFQVYAGATGDRRELTRGERHFVRFPTVKSFVGLLAEEGVAGGPELRARLLAELDAVERSLRTSDHPLFDGARVTSASEVRRRKEIDLWARRRIERASRDLGGATLLHRYQYLPFVAATLAAAEESIRVVLFFMSRSEEEGRHPSDPLFAELEAAVHRGVDVRVIIDKDEEGDVFHSRDINRAAHRFLVSRGIPVVFTSAIKVVHSKVVVVDGRHVVCGSHNWTAGSFFRYDDQSLYVESPGLAAELDRRFERLWRKGSKEAPTEDRLLRDLVTEPGSERLAETLEALDLWTAGELLEATASAGDREQLSLRSGLPRGRIDALRADLRLAQVRSRAGALLGSLPQTIDSLRKAAREQPRESTVFTLARPAAGRGATRFYLLNDRGRPGPFPDRRRGKVLLCVDNHEEERNRYRINSSGPSQRPEPVALELGPGEHFEREVAFELPRGGEAAALRFRLYKEPDLDTVYGDLELAFASAITS